MTACPKCNHDPLAPVSATWTFHIPRNIKSGNSYMVNSGPSRWAYAKERDAWMSDISKAAPLVSRSAVDSYSSKRRVTLTRFYGGRQRELDPDNAMAGAKCVIDALVRCGLLVDDRREFAEIHIVQIRTNVKEQIGTTFTIEELT